jgi:glycosyltransferase involved in cell wall biosynthesis
VGSLQPGGAERVITNIANYRAAQGLPTSLLTMASSATDFYPTDRAITRIELDLAGSSRGILDSLFANARRLRRLRAALRDARPDVVVSFIDQMNVLILLATIGMPTPIIVSERTDPRYWNPGRAWRWMRRLLYRRAAHVVVQTESVAAWAKTSRPSWNVLVIPNPVMPVDPAGRQESARNRFVIFALGRLIPEKGFDLLIQAFAKICSSFPDWQLRIGGAGPCLDSLRDLAAGYGIVDRVEFAGRIADPPTEYLKADIFALPSRAEGFPNVLLEAMSAGCAVVAFDCPSGPREIILDQEDGILVRANDVDALARSLADLIESDALRSRLGHRATRVAERFSIDSVAHCWESVFRDAVRQGRGQSPVS